jgi:hypothetical protein
LCPPQTGGGGGRNDKEDAVSPGWDKEASAAGVKDYYLMLTKKMIVTLIAENINKILLKF